MDGCYKLCHSLFKKSSHQKKNYDGNENKFVNVLAKFHNWGNAILVMKNILRNCSNGSEKDQLNLD